MNTIERDIDSQISHIMAMYGDNPGELFYKLRCLVLEWYLKGTAVKIMGRDETTMIICPHCKGELHVHHLNWSAIKCLHCANPIDRISIV